MKKPKFPRIGHKVHIVNIPKHHPYFWLATWFGCGRTAPAGVLASLVTLPLAWLILHVGGILFLGAFILLATFLGAKAAQWVNDTSQTHDARDIVIDEIVGQSITVLFLPTLGPMWWAWWVLAFVLFQICDWKKPEPAKWVDKNMHNGFSVVLDDIIAGFYAMAIVTGAYFLVA